MLKVQEYQDYRLFIRDYYEWKKRTSAFSWREFAKLSGLVSPIFLKLVTEGKSNLRPDTVERVATAMGLVEFDLLYFKALVVFNQAKKDVDRRKAYAEMQAIAKANKSQVAGSEAYTYYDNWLNPVVRELAIAMPGAKPKEIAQMCNPKVSAAEVRDCLAFLVRAGYLKKTGDDTYEQTEKIIQGSPAAIPLALRSMNRQMAKIAVSAIDEIAVNERNFTGITMGVPLEIFDKVVEKLDRCRVEILDMVKDCDNVEQVLRLNFQLFPLTKKIKRKKNEENNT